MQRSALITLMTALVTAGAGATAARAQGVVLESYPGDRPGDAEYLLAPLLAELTGRGYLSGAADLGRAIDGKLTRSGHELTSEQLAKAKRLVEDGWKQWLSGDFDGAIEDLSGAVDLFGSAPASVARNQSLRDPMRRALVGLALANKRLGNAAEATTAMAEVIRSFPDRAIDKSTFGPEAKSFYEQVQSDLESRGKGSLRIDVDDSSAVVFVNGRYITLGSTTLSDLYAGRYRVYLQQGDAQGRVHTVDVEPGEEKTLSVTWGLDSSLRTHTWVGFEFASAEDRQRDQPRYATTVARAVGGASVVVVGIDVVDGKRVMEGSVLLGDTATTLRKAYLPIEPVAPNATQVRSLALFLAGGKATSDLVVVGDNETVPVDEGPSRPFRAWKWVALGAGVAGLAAGGYLLAIDGDCKTGEIPAGGSCGELYDTTTPAYLAAGAGAALVTVGIILWIKDDPAPSEPSRTATVIPLPGGAMLGVVGSF
jgi:hypothetical protein